MTQGYYLHLPNQLSRRAVMDVGLKCPHKCLHCFTREPDRAKDDEDFSRNRHAPWRPTPQLIRQVELMKEEGFVAFDITGGEPTLHPGIVDIIQRSTDVGLASRIITLGQHLGHKQLLDRLLDAGLTDVRFSYHSCDANLFKKMTGGDHAKIHAAMQILDDKNFQYTTNTTITRANFKTLPDMAQKLKNHNIYYANFIHMMGVYGWAKEADVELRAKYGDVAPYLREAVDILEDAGIAVGVRYAPMCAVAGLEKNLVGQVGVRYDGHEWMNCVEHSGAGDAVRESKFLPEQAGHPAMGAQLLAAVEKGPPIGRGTVHGPSKFFPAKCNGCSAIAVCDGVDASYLNTHGDAEFVPYMNDHRGDVIDRDRLSYLAGGIMKLAPKADVKKVVKRLLHPPTLPILPRVSVIVPNYNHAHDIMTCLESLFRQTYPDVEIVVVDDGSTDDSLSLLAPLVKDGRIRLIKRPQASGAGAVPRNMGVKASTGFLVMTLDPDDWVEQSYIEECVRALRKNPWASIAYTGLSTFGMEEQQWMAVPFDPSREIQQNFVPVMSVYKRSMYDATGGYDESEGQHGCEDWGQWVAAVRLGYLGVPVPRQLVHYLRSPDGLFEKVTLPNHEWKKSLITLKNDPVFPIENIRAAKKYLEEKNNV